MHCIVALIVSLCVLGITHNRFAAAELQDDPGQPLFLTPYLDAGKIDEARRLRLVFDHQLTELDNLYFKHSRIATLRRLVLFRIFDC